MRVDIMHTMKTPKRTRLSPEKRRAQLLDVTQSLVLEHGLNSFTMETLTRMAGVSQPLVYKYFDTRLELLQALLLREYQRFNEHMKEELNKASSYIEIVTFMVSVNFDQYSEENIIQVLQSQSDVAAVLKPIEEMKINKLGKLLVDGLMEEYKVKRKQAEQLARMASGASLAAAEQYSLLGGNRKQQIQDTVKFIFGGFATSS